MDINNKKNGIMLMNDGVCGAKQENSRGTILVFVTVPLNRVHYTIPSIYSSYKKPGITSADYQHTSTI